MHRQTSAKNNSWSQCPCPTSRSIINIGMFTFDSSLNCTLMYVIPLIKSLNYKRIVKTCIRNKNKLTSTLLFLKTALHSIMWVSLNYLTNLLFKEIQVLFQFYYKHCDEYPCYGPSWALVSWLVSWALVTCYRLHINFKIHVICQITFQNNVLVFPCSTRFLLILVTVKLSVYRLRKKRRKKEGEKYCFYFAVIHEFGHVSMLL